MIGWELDVEGGAGPALGGEGPTLDVEGLALGGAGPALGEEGPALGGVWLWRGEFSQGSRPGRCIQATLLPVARREPGRQGVTSYRVHGDEAGSCVG